jgi:hypothetical protein
VIDESRERLTLQLRNPLKRSRYAGPFHYIVQKPLGISFDHYRMKGSTLSEDELLAAA